MLQRIRLALQDESYGKKLGLRGRLKTGQRKWPGTTSYLINRSASTIEGFDLKRRVLSISPFRLLHQ
jgi:hypothetical protein